jgi:hypothetical protein
MSAFQVEIYVPKKLKFIEFTTLDFEKEIWRMKNMLTMMPTSKKSYIP